MGGGDKNGLAHGTYEYSDGTTQEYKHGYAVDENGDRLDEPSKFDEPITENFLLNDWSMTYKNKNVGWTDKEGNLLSLDKLKDVKVFIFYEDGVYDDAGIQVDGFEDQAKGQYDDYEEEYGTGSVAMSTGEKDFLEDWQNMLGSDIKVVIMNYHGDSQWVGAGGMHMSSVGDKTAELGNDAIDITKIPAPRGGISSAHLQLNSCHANDKPNNPNQCGPGHTAGPNVMKAFEIRFFSSNQGFYSISAAGGDVSFWDDGESFSWGSFRTHYRPTLFNSMQESGGAAQWIIDAGGDPR